MEREGGREGRGGVLRVALLPFRGMHKTTQREERC